MPTKYPPIDSSLAVQFTALGCVDRVDEQNLAIHFDLYGRQAEKLRGNAIKIAHHEKAGRMNVEVKMEARALKKILT